MYHILELIKSPNNNNPTLTKEEWSWLTFTIAIAAIGIALGHHTPLLICCVITILAIVLIAVILVPHQLVICRGKGLAADLVGGGGVHLLHWLGGWGGEDYRALLCSDLTGFRVGVCEALADLLDLDRDTLAAPRD